MNRRTIIQSIAERQTRRQDMTDLVRKTKTRYTKAETQKIADSIRRQILGIALKTGGCYLAQACSSAEIIASLYTKIMNL